MVRHYLKIMIYPEKSKISMVNKKLCLIPIIFIFIGLIDIYDFDYFLNYHNTITYLFISIISFFKYLKILKIKKQIIKT